MDTQQFNDIKNEIKEIKNLLNDTNKILRNGFDLINENLGEILKDTTYFYKMKKYK